MIWIYLFPLERESTIWIYVCKYPRLFVGIWNCLSAMLSHCVTVLFKMWSSNSLDENFCRRNICFILDIVYIFSQRYISGLYELRTKLSFTTAMAPIRSLKNYLSIYNISIRWLYISKIGRT